MGAKYKVYKHTSPDGKIYIGITSDTLQRRWKGGHGYKANAPFAADIKRYGWGAFRHEVVAEGLTQAEAEQEEVALITQYESANPLKGYNQDLGGTKRSASTRAKISAALTGVPLSAERRARMSIDRKGRKLTNECKQKISESHKRNPRVQAHILELNRARAGVPHTAEHRRHISERQPARKSVINLDTGEIFGCIQDAAHSCGGSHPNIVKVCKGERATAYGYRWAYKEETTT